MRDEGVIYVAGRPLLNRRCTRLSGCFCFPKRKLELLKARYSLTVLKVPLNSNQSILLNLVTLIMNLFLTLLTCRTLRTFCSEI